MKISFFDALLYFQWGCMLGSGIVSIRLRSKNIVPVYMNTFYWYPSIASILALISFLEKKFDFISDNAFTTFNNILLLFHFLFLSNFIFKVLPNKKKAKHAKLFIFLFLVLIIFCLFIKKIYLLQPIAHNFTNVGLVLFCCTYYYQLFKEIPKGNLLSEPSFWIVNGIFFCMCATIPIYSLGEYLQGNLPHKSFLSLVSIGAFAYGVMHLFFIKAYLLCSVSVQKDQISKQIPNVN